MAQKKTVKSKPKFKNTNKKKNKAKLARAFTPTRVGGEFQKLVGVMARLRAPGGCPWDREQTHATLRTYLIEEAYEVLDAMDSGDDLKFAEELGDLLLQVLFHAQIAQEDGRFTIADVVREIYQKMIRRHQHVFGNKKAKTAADVLRNWEKIKAQERKEVQGGKESKDRKTEELESVLDGVPRTLPALLEANQLTRKAARIGFDWENVEGILAKLAEETAELQAALGKRVNVGEKPQGSGTRPGLQDIEGEVGDILFVAVNLARFLELDPEIALKKTSRKFSRRFREMERVARERGTTLAEVRREEMERLWEEAKRGE
ncbi:MAG: nucleoside triphosphate pyrophosphohydrolase [Candidatus Acidiferrum sp.]